MAKLERKTKAELIQELEALQKRLDADTAAHQLSVLQEIEQALAKEKDLDAIYEAVGNQLVTIFDAQIVGFYETDKVNNLMHFPWGNERGIEQKPDPVPLNSLYRYFIQQAGTVLINEGFDEFASQFEDYKVPFGLAPKSVLSVPIIQHPESDIIITLQDLEHEHAFSQDEVKLLETLAAAMGTALENARLFDETNRRNAELAIINSVQFGLASKLDIQLIIELVGEKVREIFNPDVTIIATYDYENEQAHYQYVAEKGERFDGIVVPFNGFHKEIIRGRKTILFNENLVEQVKPLGFEESLTPHDLPKSALNVPLIAGDNLIGHVALEDLENEHAFSDSDVRLLETLANSMSIALENARLFDETQRRNAELAVINSVQEGLAAELDIQAIYELVGDKVAEVTSASIVMIGNFRWEEDILRLEYFRSGSEILRGFERPLSDFHRAYEESIEARETIVLNQDIAEIYEQYGHVTAVREIPKTMVVVPMKIEGERSGFLSIQDSEREFAFDESTIRLVETLARDMEVALENARLFDETQQRNAELAIVNSVSEAMTKDLDVKSVVNIVGDKVQEIFNAEMVAIGLINEEKGVSEVPYSYALGEHFEESSFPLGEGLAGRMFKTREPLLLSSREEILAIGTFETEADRKTTDEIESWLGVPIIIGDKLIGGVSVQGYKKNAFDEGDMNLLSTLAANMGAVIENARLFNDTNQRAAELAVINTIQSALAAELDIQGIYDLVGDKIQEIFQAQAVIIGSFDHEKGTQRADYFLEKGERQYPPEVQISGLMKHLIETGETLVFNERAREETEKHGAVTLGEEPQTAIFVPLKVGSKVTGAISLQDVEREHAYQESDVRLLETLAGSMSVALENARLFEETNQRNAELALINTVQEGLAAELDMHGIYQLVGDKIGEITKANVVLISSWDWDTEIVHIDYGWNYGEHLEAFDRPFSQLHHEVFPELEKGKTVVWNENVDELYERTGHVIAAGEIPKTIVAVPLRIGGKIKSFVSIQDFKKEFAFDQETIRLVETLTANMGIALENALLFEETQARNAELAVINSVQEGLAAELDIQGIYQLVGDKVSEITGANVVLIGTMKWEEGTLRAEYFRDGAQILHGLDRPLSGFHLAIREDEEAGKTLIFNEGIEELYKQYGHEVAAGKMPKTMVSVPMRIGGDYSSFVSLQDTEKEFAFDDATIRLVETLTRNMETALENARLFDETQRLLNETADRNAELAVINSVQEGLASKLEIQAIYDLIGDKLREIFHADTCFIAFHDEERTTITAPYYADKGSKRPISRPYGNGIYEPIVESGNPVLFGSAKEVKSLGRYEIKSPGASQDLNESVIGVPIFKDGKAIGAATIQNYQKNAYDEGDLRLLQTITNSMSVALESARLFDETQRLLKETEERNAELAVINSVQEGLASKLEMQAIYDLVGDKISEITNAEGVLIASWDNEARWLKGEYYREKGQKIHEFERPFSRLHEEDLPELEAGKTIVRLEGLEERYREIGHEVAVGSVPKSTVTVPLKINGKINSGIQLFDTQKEHAFSYGVIRLVETLARTMGIALENASLFDETQRLLKETEERNAELAVINSVQEGLAAELEFQGIIDLVGEKIRGIFTAQMVGIGIYRDSNQFLDILYLIEKNKRYNPDPVRIQQDEILRYLHEKRKSVYIKFADQDDEYEKLGVTPAGTIPETEPSKSLLFVPLVLQNKAIGVITLQNIDQYEAFSDSDVRLLETIANSMIVALENARLFDETQRLLKETEERNTELAIINSVQASLAAKLDMQGIYDAVGDKIREVFDAQIVTIVSYNRQTDQNIIHYAIEDGERHYFDPVPTTEMYRELMETGTPIIVQENLVEQLMGKTVMLEDPAGEPAKPPKSGIWIPLSVSGTVMGHVSLQNNDRENAFSEADIRLLTTLANSMSVALENARLFDETSQRNSELAVINSVQQGLASKLDMAAIYDLVGDKVAEITGAEIVTITRWNRKDQSVRYEFILEKGVKHSGIEREMTPFDFRLITDFEKGKTFIINSGMEIIIEQENISIPAGEVPRTVVAVPIKVDDDYITNISLQDTQKEYAFDDSTIRLVETLAKSMGIALENARLFNEVQQQNQEITESLDRETASNDILRVIAESPTDIQPVLDVIARSAAHLSGSDDVVISFVHNGILTVDSHYGDVPIMPVGEGIPFNEESVAGRAIIRGVPLQAVHKPVGEPSEFPEGDKVAEKYGYKVTCAVPLMREGTAIGSITIRRIRPELLTDQQISLIQSFANQATIAIQNVRLFEETQERNAELALINSVQAGLAAELDFQGIIDLVGDKLRDVFDAQFASITEFDHTTKMLHIRYAINSGVRHYPEPIPFTRTTKYLIRTKRPFMNNRVTQETLDKSGDTVIDGTKMSKSTMFAPLIANDKVFGSISIQDEENYDSFTESDLQLLTTIANSMSVALENARLFGELQTRNEEITASLERQTATSDILHIIANSPGEIQPVLDAVAEHSAKLCEADDVQIYRVDGNQLVQVSHYGPLPALNNGESLPLDAGLATGKAVLERKTIQMDAGELSEEEFPISVGLQKRLKHRSVIMTPLVREGKSIGAIVARRNEVREFSEIQENLLRTFADQAAIAIENVRLFEETKRLLSESQQQAKELKTVNTVSQTLSAEIELDVLIEMIGNQVQNIFSADIAYVALLDAETQMINFPYIHGENIRPLKLGEGLASQVIQEGAPVLINQDEQWESAGERIGVKSKSYLGIPIFAAKEVIGAISIQSTQWSNMYGEADERLLSTIAANVGAAISNANLFSEVERQKVYLEALISSAPVAIVQIDLHGDVSGWSPAAEELFGYTADEAIGNNIDDLVANDPSVREEAENYTKINLIKPGPHQIQIKTQRTHKDGHLIDVTVSAMPVYIEGEHKGYIAIYNDISQLEKARRDAEEANQAKSAFLANMSHELRTPLNAIIGFTRIVKRKGRGVLEEKQLDNLDKVLVSAEHLLGLINTVLDISKIEAGRMDIHVSNFEIKPLIDLLVVTTQPLIREETVRLIVDVDKGIPLIHTDLEKIKQILLNLLSNAAKFTHQGEIRVTVCHTDGFLEVDVTDTGIGIAPEALDSVFEEFQQADVSTTREYGGTGLGLSISRSLARLLGGDLRVVSELGKGSTFTLTIPVDLATAAVVEKQGTVSEMTDGDQLVLVIDDNPDAIYLMQENLQNAGYRVAVARNGEDGLAMAKDLKPFAITLDIMMPKKDGWQVLHDLKLDPETRNIPVIMISIVDKKALGFRLGAADYLVKPLDESQVLVSLEKLKKQNGDRPLKRLLVVDDDPNIPDMVRQLLEDSSYQVESASDGQEAWERIQKDRPDAILLDLMMPKMDGFALIDRLNQDKQYSDLPVIVLTAKLLSKKERDSLNDSVGRVIQKQGLAGEALLNEIRSSIRETI